MRYIKLFILVVTTSFFVSCGMKPEGRNFEVSGYVAGFYTSAYSIKPELKEDENFIAPVSVEFADLKSFKTNGGNRVAGVCYIGERRVVLDRETWFSEGISDDARRIVIYHEFAHCALKRYHINEYMNLNGVRAPASIMNGELTDIGVIKNNFSYYINELFDPTIKTQNYSLLTSDSDS